MFSIINSGVLGKEASYKDTYDKSLLHPISRESSRNNIGIEHNLQLPFYGFDMWNCYELSWLDMNGKPEVRILRFFLDCRSENIIESKSLKLYLNSFNNSKFSDVTELQQIIESDLSAAAQYPVIVQLLQLQQFDQAPLSLFDAQLIDHLPVQIAHYRPDAKLLRASKGENVREKLYSNLLKSNCLVTNQPDWASLYIEYQGSKIDHHALLKYIISFRNHQEFHEQCVERIFTDLIRVGEFSSLVVYAKYTRRGGIDINPYRSMKEVSWADLDNARDIRQ